MGLWIILGIVAVILVALIFIYNGLVRAKVRVDEAWSDITVQMKRRFDLIPNLVNTVKGYATHESSVFEKVTEARANSISAQGQGVAETAKAENQFQAALKSLFAVAEAYPDLKANQGFQQLQAELVDTEDKIQAARRFYNGSARDLNIKIQTFPTNIFASMFGFKIREFFDVDEGQAAAVAEPVKVDFNANSDSNAAVDEKAPESDTPDSEDKDEPKPAA
jgi:LemA protein